MPKKKKKRMSLENLKDLEAEPEKIPRKNKIPQKPTTSKSIIQEKSPSDEPVNEELEKLFEQLNKWKIAHRVNSDMQMQYRDTVRECKEIREDLKKEIADIRTIANTAKNQRDKINEKVNELKKQRSEANEKIKEYKNKRDEKWTEVKQIREQFRNMINQKKDLREKLFKAKKLSQIIESLDWELQTVSMDWEKECELMDQIEDMFHQFEQIKEVKKFKDISNILDNYSSQLDKLRTEANQYHQLMLDFVEESNFIHNQILESVKESDQYHSEMITSFEKTNKLQIQEEEAHQNMMNAVQELNLLRKGEQEIERELQIVRKKLGKLREKEEALKSKETKKILDEKAQKILKKYKAGQKLTINEFRILMRTDKLKE